MGFITTLLQKAGLVRSGEETDEATEESSPATPSPGQAQDTETLPLVVPVDDLSPEVLAQMEAEGLVHLEDTYIEPLTDEAEIPALHTVYLHDLLASAALGTQEDQAEDTLAESLGLEATVSDVVAASSVQLQKGSLGIEQAAAWLKELRSEGLPFDQMATALQQILKQRNTSESRLMTDAALKDKAVDRYEAALKERVGARDKQLADRADTLRARLTALEQEAAMVTKQRAELQEQMAHWCATKTAIEEEWAAVLDLLIPGGGTSVRGGRLVVEDSSKP